MKQVENSRVQHIRATFAQMQTFDSNQPAILSRDLDRR
jgi:hypothetical protein